MKALIFLLILFFIATLYTESFGEINVINDLPSLNLIDAGSVCSVRANNQRECQDADSLNLNCTDFKCREMEVIAWKQPCNTISKICGSGLFCISGACHKIVGPGSEWSADDHGYVQCTNSLQDNTNRKCIAFNVTTYAKENEECDTYFTNKGEKKNCEVPFVCVKGKCRALVGVGERCHTGTSDEAWPTCKGGLVCNLGYCVPRYSLPYKTPADNLQACQTGMIEPSNGAKEVMDWCAERCVDGNKCGGVDDSGKICNNGTCTEIYSIPDGQRADHDNLCESGMRAAGTHWCIPQSREICYSNFDCKNNGVCRGADIKGNKPGACTDSYNYLNRLYSKEFYRCLNQKHLTECAKDFTSKYNKVICAQNCFQKRIDFRYGSVGSYYSTTFDCSAETSTSITAVGQVTEFFKNCDLVIKNYAGVGINLPSIVVMIAMILLSFLF